MRRPAGPLAAALSAAAAAAGTVFYALVVGPRRTVMRSVTLRLPHWPADLDGVVLALVGDLHAGAVHVDVDRVTAIAQRIARRRPHVVLCAGDLMDDEAHGARHLDAAAVAKALSAAGHPRLAVIGNHDRSYGEDAVRGALAGAGFTVLENEAVALTVRGRRLWIAGVADAESGEPRPTGTLDSVGENEPVVVLTHSPDVFPRIPDRVALTVAGHTHGGQVAAPRPLRARIIPSRFGTRYDRGHVVEDGRHLFVTSGVGTSTWPIRLGVAPEVVLLRLRAPRRGRGRRRAAGR